MYVFNSWAVPSFAKIRNAIGLVFLLSIGVSAHGNDLVGNTIQQNEYGLFLIVYDHRPSTLVFMRENELQGGGPTWMGLITAALELESPETLNKIEFNDEADVILITSKSKLSLEIVQARVQRLMEDKKFMQRSISKGREGLYLE